MEPTNSNLIDVTYLLTSYYWGKSRFQNTVDLLKLAPKLCRWGVSDLNGTREEWKQHEGYLIGWSSSFLVLLEDDYYPHPYQKSLHKIQSYSTSKQGVSC